MQLRPSPEQQQLVDAFAALLGKHASPEHVRAAEPLGFDERLWSQLLELGVVAMAVDEAHGGWGASLVDLALVAEQLGRFVAPAPVVETQVAARLLARLADDNELAAATLARAVDGEQLVTLAVRPAHGGVATLVPAGAVADAAVVLDGDRLVLVTVGGPRPVIENLGSMPLADLTVPADAPVLAEGTAALAALDAALDDWLALTGAALVGVGARALEIGVEYVKERYAWGVPIGSFQAISHRLADSAAALDGARLLAYQAAWAPLGDPARHPELAAESFAIAYEAARDATGRSLHFHGGYGFMMEYDIQLYYRRARAWANVWGNGETAFRRAADKRYAAHKPAGEPARQDGIDFTPSEDGEAIRAEVRAFLDGFMTHEREERLYRSGVSHDPEFTQAMVDRGWMTSRWPLEGSGGHQSPDQIAAFAEELRRADAPTYAPQVTMMVAKVVELVGTEEMKAEILPKALAGEIIIVLGFTEPEAGSDVANAQCRAVRDGEEWVINGQKMFTTNAHIADYCFLLTRSNTEVAKHKGLTMFLVPLKQDGVEIQPVYTLSGERTNIVFYTDVRIPDAARIGDVDGGWKVMTVSLQDEHSGGYGARIARVVDEVEDWVRDAVDADGRPRLDDPDLRGRIARAATEAEVSMLLERRIGWMHQEGLVAEAEGPMNKLYSSEAMVRATEDLVEALGPDALRSFFEPTAPVNGRIEHAMRFSLGTTIYAGTSEVQRNIIAQRAVWAFHADNQGDTHIMDINDLVLVSVDDHVVEPGDMWDAHLPAKYQEHTPKLIQRGDGVDVWTYNGTELPNVGLNAVAGRPPAEYGLDAQAFSQMRPGCYDHVERVRDMDANGVLGSLNFPSMSGFAGQLWAKHEDKDVSRALLQAYNDWHIDEWCGSHPGRFIPLALPALWDPTVCAEEMRRVAAKGCRAVTFSENPEKLGYPSLHNEHWDPFWQACSDEGIVVCMHIGSSSQVVVTAADAPLNVMITLQPMNLVQAAADLLWSRVLQKYPDLRFAMSEGGIGWIPYFLERSDYVYKHHKEWTGMHLGGRLPSELFHERIITCFIDDAVGLANRDRLNIDNVTWECDYPHSDSTWPRSPETLHPSLDGMTDEEIDKVTHLNAMRVFDYDPFSVLGGRERCTVGALRAQSPDVDVREVAITHTPPRDPSEPPITILSIMEMVAKSGTQ